MSNINLLVLEGLGEGLGALAGASGGVWARRLLGGGAEALGTAMGMPGLGTIASGATTAALNLLKNYSDPVTKYDHAGNVLRALGAGVSGSVPILGDLAAAYNAGVGSHNILKQSAEYNRHQQLQNYANQVAMLQQAKQGVVPQQPIVQPPSFSLPFMNQNPNPQVQ